MPHEWRTVRAVVAMRVRGPLTDKQFCSMVGHAVQDLPRILTVQAGKITVVSYSRHKEVDATPVVERDWLLL